MHNHNVCQICLFFITKNLNCKERQLNRNKFVPHITPVTLLVISFTFTSFPRTVGSGVLKKTNLCHITTESDSELEL